MCRKAPEGCKACGRDGLSCSLFRLTTAPSNASDSSTAPTVGHLSSPPARVATLLSMQPLTTGLFDLSMPPWSSKSPQNVVDTTNAEEQLTRTPSNQYRTPTGALCLPAMPHGEYLKKAFPSLDEPQWQYGPHAWEFDPIEWDTFEVFFGFDIRGIGGNVNGKNEAGDAANGEI